MTSAPPGAIPESSLPALDFREWLGGEAKINAYCHALALAGGQRLAEILGTSVMGSEELILNIVRFRILP